MLQVGSPSTLAKFLSVSMAVLMVGGAAVSMNLHKYGLAIACAFVGGWSLMMFFELFKEELINAIKANQRPTDDWD